MSDSRSFSVLSFGSLLSLVTLGAACVGPVGETPWEITVSEIQSFAEEVDAEGDVDALENTQGFLDSVAVELDDAGGLTPERCATLRAQYNPTELSVKKNAHVDERKRLNRARLMVLLASLPSLRDFAAAVRSHGFGNFQGIAGLSAEELEPMIVSLDAQIDGLVTRVSDFGISRAPGAEEEFAAGGAGTLAQALLAHEAAHVLQQRGGGASPQAIQLPLDQVMELVRHEEEVAAALKAYSGSVSSIFTQLETLFATEESCASAPSDQISTLRGALDMANRRFQTLSNASKARHDIALNSIRNMKA
ncbi:MAG: hypothetical protein IT285_03165 [Bdellovibrionales bacterium]|nr:hypothetical protein [Bdellovibrionales bacterium]